MKKEQFPNGVHAEKEPGVASEDQDLGMFVLSPKQEPSAKLQWQHWHPCLQSQGDSVSDPPGASLVVMKINWE